MYTMKQAQKVSCKTKETAPVTNDEWIITRDMQDAINDKETLQTAHRIRENGKNRKFNIHDNGALNGSIFCSDCGSKLHFKSTTRLNDKTGCYMCGYNLCSSHYIRRCDLEAAFLADNRRVTTFANVMSCESRLQATKKKRTVRNGS